MPEKEEESKVVKKDARKKLGEEKYQELLEKDWKKAKVPPNYENKKGKDGRKLNKKSLQNLVQYRKRTQEEKETALNQLQFKEKVEAEEKSETARVYTGLIDRLKNTIPIKDIFKDEEIPIFFEMLDFYLEDFDEEDLTANDIDDLISIAQNRVLEMRLLKYGRDKPSAQIDVSQSIERLRKQTEKAKENLLARRRDRLSGKDAEKFTVIDLVASYENNKKQLLEERVAYLREGEKDFVENRPDYGNKNDPDALVVEYEELDADDI